jgi:hypothetical protein
MRPASAAAENIIILQTGLVIADSLNCIVESC